MANQKAQEDAHDNLIGRQACIQENGQDTFSRLWTPAELFPSDRVHFWMITCTKTSDHS